MKIKETLRRVLPVSRTYIDDKLLAMERQIIGKIEKQEKQWEIQKKFMDAQKKTLQEMKAKDSEQQKALENIKRYIDFQQQKAVDNIQKYIEQELRRRDDWQVRPAENERTAEGKTIWVIKCPAPEGEARVRWGDYPFALSLKKYLERLECHVIIDHREDWGCEEGADVVLVLRGCFFYRPDRRNKECIYIMWNISHPDMVTAEEYELYDIVCVGSRHYAAKLKSQLSVPVFPLLQCTDTEEFYPPENEEEKKWDYIFIGNSRGVARSCVMWAIEENLPLRMWGSGWNTILKDHMDLFEAPTIENGAIPALYRAAKVTLNDHWKDMLQNQFVNNRIFDALACGLPVISDACEELREIFPDAVLYYTDKEDFKKCVEELENNYGKVRERVLEQWELIQKEYSFEARAKELVELAKNCRIRKTE